MKRLVASLVGTAVYFLLVLFIPAGTLAWPAGWMYLGVYIAFVLIGTFWLMRFNPELLLERLTGIGGRGQKRFDQWLLAVGGVVFTGWMVSMPLDAVRFGWSRVPSWVSAIGAVLLLVSFWLFYLAARHNSFLSPAIRIQSERGHQVVTGGPYRYVRHPMYAGALPMIAGTSFMLGSWLGVLTGLPVIAMVGLRAVLEERVLTRELQGYREYASRVRYRLVPGIW